MSEPRNPQRRIGSLAVDGESPQVVALLSTAAGPADEAELQGEATAVATFVTARSAAAGSAAAGRPRRRLATRTVRVVGAASVLAVVCGGGLAAADVLPDPAQRVVSRALDVIGIDVPSPDRPGDGPSAAGRVATLPAPPVVRLSDVLALQSPAAAPMGATVAVPTAAASAAPSAPAGRTRQPQGPGSTGSVPTGSAGTRSAGSGSHAGSASSGSGAGHAATSSTSSSSSSSSSSGRSNAGGAAATAPGRSRSRSTTHGSGAGRSAGGATPGRATPAPARTKAPQPHSDPTPGGGSTSAVHSGKGTPPAVNGGGRAPRR